MKSPQCAFLPLPLGTSRLYSGSGDGGPAVDADLSFPHGMTLDGRYGTAVKSLLFMYGHGMHVCLEACELGLGVGRQGLSGILPPHLSPR